MRVMDRALPRVFETNDVALAVRLQSRGWQLSEVLAAPPAAGGSTFVMRWTREWPPRVEGASPPCEDDPRAPLSPDGVRLGIEDIEAFLAEAAKREAVRRTAHSS